MTLVRFTYCTCGVGNTPERAGHADDCTGHYVPTGAGSRPAPVRVGEYARAERERNIQQRREWGDWA